MSSKTSHLDRLSSHHRPQRQTYCWNKCSQIKLWGQTNQPNILNNRRNKTNSHKNHWGNRSSCMICLLSSPLMIFRSANRFLIQAETLIANNKVRAATRDQIRTISTMMLTRGRFSKLSQIAWSLVTHLVDWQALWPITKNKWPQGSGAICLHLMLIKITCLGKI